MRVTGSAWLPYFVSQEAADNVRKVAQFNRPIIQSNLFKSSPNAVASLTGATASRLPSSCQSTHSLLASVQRKTLMKFGGNIFLGPPNISPNFEFRVPNFFLQLERNGLQISAKFCERVPGSQSSFSIFGRWSSLQRIWESWV